MNQTATGIEIGATSLTAVRMRRSKGGRIEVVGVAREELGDLADMPDSPQKAALVRRRLKSLLRREGIKPDGGVIGVSGRQTRLSYETLPVVPQWRLQEMMGFQAEQQIAQGEPSCWDYRVMDVGHLEGQYVVLLGLAQEALTRERMADAKAVGIGSPDIDFAELGLYNAWRYGHGPEVPIAIPPMDEPAKSDDASDGDDKSENEDEYAVAEDPLAEEPLAPVPEETVCIVDIGATEVRTIITRGEILLAARSQTGGGSRFTQALAEEFDLEPAAAEALKLGQGKAPVGVPDPSQARATPGSSRGESEGREGGEASAPAAQRWVGGQKKTYEMCSPEEVQVRAGRVLMREAATLSAGIDSAVRMCQRELQLGRIKLDRMLVTGQGSKLPGLTDFMARRLRTEIGPLDPFRQLSLERLSAGTVTQVRQDATAYATAAGLALSRMEERAFTCSLLPEEEKERRRFLATDVYVYAAAVFFLIALALYVYLPQRKLNYVTQEASKLEQIKDEDQNRRSRFEEVAAEYERADAEVRALVERDYSGRVVMRVLSQLKKLTPPSVCFTEVSTTVPKQLQKYENEKRKRENEELEARGLPTKPLIQWREGTTLQDLGRVYLSGYARVRMGEVDSPQEAMRRLDTEIIAEDLKRNFEKENLQHLFEDVDVPYSTFPEEHNGYYVTWFILEARLAQS